MVNRVHVCQIAMLHSCLTHPGSCCCYMHAFNATQTAYHCWPFPTHTTHKDITIGLQCSTTQAAQPRLKGAPYADKHLRQRQRIQCAQALGLQCVPAASDVCGDTCNPSHHWHPRDHSAGHALSAKLTSSAPHLSHASAKVPASRCASAPGNIASPAPPPVAAPAAAAAAPVTPWAPARPGVTSADTSSD
jgi:hypothetical protein